MQSGDERSLQRVIWLLLTRVFLLLVVFAAALILGERGGAVSEAAEDVLLAAVVGGMAASAVWALAHRWYGHSLWYGGSQALVDVVVVTAIVACTGGGESIFSSLYVLVAAYVASLFDRRFAIVTALAASAAYGLVLLGGEHGWFGGLVPASHESASRLLVDAAWKSVLFLAVAVLASLLSRELQRTDRALNERTRDLGRLRHLYERTVQSLESGLLTTDSAGHITSFNVEAVRITGVSTAEAMGQPLEAILPGAGALTAAASGEAVHPRQRIPYTNRAGEALYLGLAASTLKDVDGKATGHVLIFQDVTRVVEMEDQLRLSERLAAVGELSAAIAHEVRNPLASISGSVQILMAGLGETEADRERHRLMDIVVRETDRLDQLIGDFLHYARPVPPKRKLVTVSPLIDELVEMYGAAQDPDDALQIEVEGDAEVYADPDQLRQLLWNLLRNGADAMAGAGVLAIGVHELPQEPSNGDRSEVEGGSASVEILVSDTGQGIAPDILDRIFDPFFTTKSEGSGLGLATVHRIVESHGGSVGVESEVGVGTTFRVRLPGLEAEA